METFETSALINEGTMKEVKYHLLSPRRKTVILVIVLAAALLLVLAIAVQSTVLTVAAAVALPLFILEYFYIQHRNGKLMLKRIEETAHVRELRYTTSLVDSGIQITNHITGGNTVISYGDIRRVKETRSFYIVFTKAEQFTLLNRAAIDSAGKREALRAFLQSRCRDLRWK